MKERLNNGMKVKKKRRGVRTEKGRKAKQEKCMSLKRQKDDRKEQINREKNKIKGKISR